MILTGKAKEDFEKWLEEGNHTPWVAFFYNLPDTVMYAYYQEWFDMVGIFCSIEYLDHLKNFTGKVKCMETLKRVYLGLFFTRPEATKAAILTANDLYNER